VAIRPTLATVRRVAKVGHPTLYQWAIRLADHIAAKDLKQALSDAGIFAQGIDSTRCAEEATVTGEIADGGVAEILKAHRPVGKLADGEWPLNEDLHALVAVVGLDYGEEVPDGVVRSFEGLYEVASLVEEHAGDLRALVRGSGLLEEANEIGAGEGMNGGTDVDQGEHRLAFAAVMAGAQPGKTSKGSFPALSGASTATRSGLEGS
jgi:hypothetical protein